MDVEDLVASAFRRTMDEGDVGAVDEFFSEQVVYHRSSGDPAGRRELAGDIETFHAAFPDLECEITRMISRREKISFIFKPTQLCGASARHVRSSQDAPAGI